MNTPLQALFFVICLFFTTTMFAQNNDLAYAKILDVYGQQFIDNNPELVPVFRDFLTNRVEYKIENLSTNEKYPKLSEFGLRNKNNPSLSRDLSFDNNNFNPLKYNISAFENKTQIIRFDDSNILIIVKPITYPSNSN